MIELLIAINVVLSAWQKHAKTLLVPAALVQWNFFLIIL